jgi:phosphohistidine phosphatase SixA
MRGYWMLGAAIILLAAGCQPSHDAGQNAAPLLRDQAAIEALKDGGYVVYLRHGHTLAGKDSDFTRLDNCDTQRNLSPQGADQSRAMAAAIARLKLPVSSVAVSPFCRTRATAQLALGAAPIEPALASWTDMPATQRDAANSFVRRQFATPVTKRSNVFLVGHSPPFDAATQQLQPSEFKDKPFLEEGDAALIQADGKGGFRLAGHIGVKSWIQSR